MTSGFMSSSEAVYSQGLLFLVGQKIKHFCSRSPVFILLQSKTFPLLINKPAWRTSLMKPHWLPMLAKRYQMFWPKFKNCLQTFNKNLPRSVALFPTNSTLFLNSCVTLLQTVAICFCFTLIVIVFTFGLVFPKAKLIFTVNIVL